MANIHLTNDNGVAAFHESKNHLGGVYTSQRGDHLVVVKQTVNWSNKELVVTPTEMKYNQGWSCGLEQYNSQQGGTAVYNDTNRIINNVKDSISTHPWKTGQCALFAVSSRSAGPYAWYQYYKHYNPQMPTPNQLSEYGASVVAYKFNLRHLHLSKMSNSFTAYVRAWAPSLVVGFPALDVGDDGILISGGLYNSGSCLRVKLFDELPAIAWDVADSGDSFEFANNCNDGRIVTQDTAVYGQMVDYVPFGGNIAYSTTGNSARIYTREQNAEQNGSTPTNYYHDFQISNQDNLDFLKDNPGEMWLVAHFHMGNAFSQGATNHNGLNVGRSATVFSERLELVLKCTS